MAQIKISDELNSIDKKSSAAIIGTTSRLNDETEKIRNIIRSTIKDTVDRYGEYTGNKPIEYYNEINISKIFASVINDPNKRKQFQDNPDLTLRTFMNETSQGSAQAILASEGDRILTYKNYRSIYDNIPECAQAIDVYKDNIMSPDDFTKTIFNVSYDIQNDDELKEKVENNISKILKKYQIDELADEIIGNGLIYGDQYVAVLSLEKELQYMMSDNFFNNGNNVLNEETLRLADPDSIFKEITTEDIELSDIDEETSALTESFSEMYNGGKEHLNEEQVKASVCEMINKNVKIGSKKELLMERYLADKENRDKNDILSSLNLFSKSVGSDKKTQKIDSKPLFINGSSIKNLDPSMTVDLTIDNINYGYFYIEKSEGLSVNQTGRDQNTEAAMVSKSLSPSINNGKFSVDMNNFSSDGISDPKADLVSKVFLNALSKKLNKDFIRKNKDMKDFIFSLVKQNYILNHGIKVTYFAPEDVVSFKVPPIYRKITLFARLYMANLINALVVNMGRGHDKRLVYVEMGLDGNYEQAIQKTIQSLKTKEFRMDSFSDVNSIVRLNPGKFDDIYIPQYNGNRPIDIDTLPGMDKEIDTEFTNFLKTSMLSGMGVPANLIDDSRDVDFARTLSARNANFVRQIIRYQKKFTPSLSKLVRILYKNETMFNNDKEINNENIVYQNINVHFPSPASLNMSNMTEQIQIADSNADFIVNNIYPTANQDMYLEEKAKLKSKIIQDLVPGIDWIKYKEYAKEIDLQVKEDLLQNPPQQDQMY